MNLALDLFESGLRKRSFPPFKAFPVAAEINQFFVEAKLILTKLEEFINQNSKYLSHNETGTIEILKSRYKTAYQKYMQSLNNLDLEKRCEIIQDLCRKINNDLYGKFRSLNKENKTEALYRISDLLMSTKNDQVRNEMCNAIIGGKATGNIEVDFLVTVIRINRNPLSMGKFGNTATFKKLINEINTIKKDKFEETDKENNITFSKHY